MEGRDSERPGLEGAIRTIASGRATPLGGSFNPGSRTLRSETRRTAGPRGPALARNGLFRLTCLLNPLPVTVALCVPSASDA